VFARISTIAWRSSRSACRRSASASTIALLLAEVFLQEASARAGKTVRAVSTAAARALLAYSWPGNVRELKNALDYAVTVAEFDHLSESDLPEAVHSRRSHSDDTRADDPRWSAVERQHIEAVLPLGGRDRGPRGAVAWHRSSNATSKARSPCDRRSAAKPPGPVERLGPLQQGVTAAAARAFGD